MLHEFLSANRQELINRCQGKVAKRLLPTGITEALGHGVPLFLQQLVDTLRLEQTTSLRNGDSPPAPASREIGRAAALHGADLLRLGYSVDQVVHDYGDVCQSVTALAVEQAVSINTDEFRTLNRCLDDAIADAVSAFGAARQVSIAAHAQTLQQRLDHFVDEQRRLVDIAIQSYAAIRTGNVGLTGATGSLLAFALDEIRSLANRTLPDVRLASQKITIAAA